MDLTVFKYITEIPEVIDNESWYVLAVNAYNLGLCFFWTYLAIWITDKLFICFRSIHSRGHE